MALVIALLWELAEQTDAVVLVISESGAITIARGGLLSRPVDEEQRLVKMLLAVTRPPRWQRRRGDFIGKSLRSRLRGAAGRGFDIEGFVKVRRPLEIIRKELCAQSAAQLDL